MRIRLLIIAFFLVTVPAAAQHLNVGMTFQYLILKQVGVASGEIIPQASFNYYKVDDNRWKFFSAGQSFVIGTIAQLDYKKVFFAIEPSYELNTYDYTVKYPLSPTAYEKVTFKTLFFQLEAPVYMGYQFASSTILRYSVFAGAEPVFPYHLEARFDRADDNPGVYSRYGVYDMKNILYSDKLYWNSLVGIGFHFASLGRVDLRYKHRLNSPGVQYKTSFNTIGIALTYFLPLHLLKKKIYYED
jgi:hypothetical protein